MAALLEGERLAAFRTLLGYSDDSSGAWSAGAANAAIPRSGEMVQMLRNC